MAPQANNDNAPPRAQTYLNNVKVAEQSDRVFFLTLTTKQKTKRNFYVFYLLILKGATRRISNSEHG